MIRKIEEATGTFDGAGYPFSGEVEVSWMLGRSSVRYDGVTITLPKSLVVVETAHVEEINEESERLRAGQMWEPVTLGDTIACACKESVQCNCHVAIMPSHQYGERLEVMDGADVVSIILPANVRLCILASRKGGTVTELPLIEDSYGYSALEFLAEKPRILAETPFVLEAEEFHEALERLKDLGLARQDGDDKYYDVWHLTAAGGEFVKARKLAEQHQVEDAET